MKAIIWTKYGKPNVLQLQEVEKPVPKDDEILIKIYATTAFAGDIEVRSLKLPTYLAVPLRVFIGILKPKRIRILGQELAGEIEAIGENVEKFQVGDKVFGTTGFGMGAYAEYKCMPEKSTFVIKPTNISFEEAAAVPVGGLEALHFMKIGNIKKGEKILINGAGGSIGTFAVQLAKYFGAVVTAVDRTEKLDLLRSLGAEHVIDYTQEDFTMNGQQYDLIFDVVGKSHFARSVQMLKDNGRYIIGNPKILDGIRGRKLTKKTNKRVITQTANSNTKDLLFLKKLLEEGNIKTIIDRVYPLDQTANAHTYVETGMKKGNVIISVEHNS